ncbi:MAG: hypothetical protein IAI49_16195, partial [Candidatus Eremiobacteraeota bacterium]|nr:hypothetical protein [Candidatus Eremiobacteraeota bacterium]
EVGVTYNRVFDVSGSPDSGSGSTAPVAGEGLVSDTVLGIDAQLPVPLALFGRGAPTLFGEAVHSSYTADAASQAVVGDFAAVTGLKFRLAQVDVSVQYQSVGPNFFGGAPLRYFGNVPQLLASNRLGYLPDFFGFGNDLGIDEQFDNQFTTAGLASPNSRGNPNLTFLNPIFNPLRASGPEYFSSFAPNSQGLTAALTSPMRVGETNLTVRGSYQSLQEIAPNGGSTSLFGPTFSSTAPLRYTTYSAGAGLQVPLFGRKANVDLTGTYETLKRLDTTARQYYPIDPGTNAYDAGSIAAAAAAFPAGGTFGSGSRVSYFPNYVNVRHKVYLASLSMPLTANVTLGASYTTQLYGGSYGTTATQNISERKDYYTGSLTYNIPRTNSS